MHEMSLCMSLIDLIAERGRVDGFAHVERVTLEIGTLSHVEPEAMRFGFDVAACGTLAEGAELAIERSPGKAWCVACEQEKPIAARGEGCPDCGSHQLLVTGGEELRLKSMEVR